MILTFTQLKQSAPILKTDIQSLVLVGGCFDILHSGHIEFLKKARIQGDILVILLESDNSIKKKKGPDRPINSQLDRADFLQELRSVNHVVLMPESTTDADYYEVTKLLKPAIIATTKGDPARKEKELCAQAVNGQVVDVIDYIAAKSSSHIADLLKKEDL